MSTTSDFLELYRQYETALRGRGASVTDMEGVFDDVRSQKLRICRQMRNYMSHNEGGFIEPTAKQVKFMRDMIMDECDTAKSAMVSKARGTVVENGRCDDALSAMASSKREVIGVVDKKGLPCGYAYIYDIMKPYLKSKAAKMGDVSYRKTGWALAAPSDLLENLPRQTLIFVTADGTAEGRVMGTVWRA